MFQSTQAKPTELDQYFVKKQILDSAYKIKDRKALNEILDVISDEDSRTLPFQIDQNMLMEKYQVNANEIKIEGIITTPDFAQFALDVGDKEVKKLMRKNILQSCSLLFENEFQRVNPYHVELKLSSESQSYDFKIKNKECSF
ncbi:MULTISPECIES: hypothetical protein [unclassified Acinetobacter]|uniref:hypothetical protein n=1 Tax=unclassified Acinetobacter TaxID=196816 RepID=UPI0025B9E3FD|nr:MULTISPECIES: hypothetical protein [unclassified Acinetobacter]